MPVFKKELVLEPFIIGAIAIMLLVPGVLLTTRQNALGYVLIVMSVPFLLMSLADAVGFVYLLFRAPPALSVYDSVYDTGVAYSADVIRMMNAKENANNPFA